MQMKDDSRDEVTRLSVIRNGVAAYYGELEQLERDCGIGVGTQVE
jgi:hypothetical protein